ncbi:MAG TPA: hypothetical protein VH596_06435 [Terriglobales bacterium]
MLPGRVLLLGVVVGALNCVVPNCFSQTLKDSQRARIGKVSAFRWNLTPDLLQKLSRSIRPSARVSFPVQNRPTPEMIAAAKQHYRTSQSQVSTPASHSHQLLSASRQENLVSSTSSDLAAPERTQAAARRGMLSTAPGMAAQARGNKTRGVSSANTGEVRAGLRCLRPGIDDVSGSNGVDSLILLEPGKNYVIHGCGFGNHPGEVYLTGVRRQSATSSTMVSPTVLGIHQHPDWIRLLPSVGADPRQAQAWTDSEIQVVVDTHTSGFYDNYWSATVLVIPGNGKPQVQSVPGFGFWAVRVEQTLPAIPFPTVPSGPKELGALKIETLSWFTPENTKDITDHAVQANVFSPSADSLVMPGHTFAVVRDDNAASFAGGQDEMNTSPSLMGLNGGFQVSYVQLFTAGLSPEICPTGSNFSNSGKWNTVLSNYANPDKYVVSWQEQSCGSGGISAYAVDIIVVGPRGVSPLVQ